MTAQPSTERRRFLRVSDQKQVLFQVFGVYRDAWKKASLQNISGGGIGLSFFEPVSAGDLLWVKFLLSEPAGEISATAKIAWCSRTTGNEYRGGAEFEDLPESDRTKIIRHVFSRQKKAVPEK